MDKVCFAVVALILTLLNGFDIDPISIYNARKPRFQLF